MSSVNGEEMESAPLPALAEASSMETMSDADSTIEATPAAAEVEQEEEPKIKTSCPEDEVKAIIQEVTDDVLSGEVYQHSRAAGWNAAVVERCLSKLTACKRSYKYVVTCLVMQQSERGAHAATSCFWDRANDGYATYQFESKSMRAIVNAYCLSV